mgnify:CR=1 FL=1|tara:strand:- start:5085 stop:6224 length:1140 start_codon:yes stop_codon:yes gene_type:complete
MITGELKSKVDLDGIAQIRMNNVSTDGTLSFENLRRVPKEFLKNESKLLRPGDIIFNSTNSPNLVGKTAYFEGFGEGISYSNHFLKIKTNDKILHPKYLTKWLTLQQQQGFFEANCIQWVNQATFKKEFLLKVQIPLPPLEEQKRIAEILDKADALRQQRKQAIAKLDTLLQSIFLDMFGDPITNPKDWEVKKLGEVCGTCEKINPEKLPSDDFTYIDIASIDRINGKISDPKVIDTSSAPSRARQLVRKGDVIVSTVRPNLKGTSLVNEEYDSNICSTGFAVLRPKDSLLCSQYLYLITRLDSFTDEVVKKCTGANYPAITEKNLRSIELPVPPIDKQELFSKCFYRQTEIKSLQVDEYNKLDTLFNSLQQRAFKGEL